MDFRDLFRIRKEEQQPQWTPIPSATDRATPPPLPLRKDVVENEARMNAINNTLKNWDTAMKLREATKQPIQDSSPQAQNLHQAEEDLQQAKEEDAQSGSEGYEKKEDGIFSRMANWGSSAGEYLFGKRTPEEDAAERSEEERAAVEKADKGVIGYYYDKLMGTRTPEEEAKIAADKERMGWLGYYGKKANDTLETMARSPFSKFVDPTTLLGGQQSMVEDIDADYKNRGLHSLRRELLEQDKARMGTSIGQAQEYARIMNDPNVPEEQKAAITQYIKRASSDAGLQIAKTREQDYLRRQQELESRVGRPLTTEERTQLAQYLGASSPEEIFSGVQDSPKTPEQAAILDKAAEEKRLGRRLTPEEIDDIDRYHGAGKYAISKQYTPGSIAGAGEKAQLEKTQGSFGEEISNTINSVDSAIINKANASAALAILEDHPEYAGSGDFGKAVRLFGETYGIARGSYSKLAYLVNRIKGGQISDILKEQNVGQVSNAERENFDRQTVDLGNDPESVKAGLKLYILSNDLALDSADFLINKQASGVYGPRLQSDYFTYKRSRAPETARAISNIVSPNKTVTAIDKRTGKTINVRKK